MIFKFFLSLYIHLNESDSNILKLIAKIVRILRLNVLSHKILYLYERYHPTTQMMECQLYYSNNVERIKKIEDYLSDDFSKDVYKKMINFKCYRKDFPIYSEKDIYIPSGIIHIGRGSFG